MKVAKSFLFFSSIALFMLASCRTAFVKATESGMLVRLSEIEIYPANLQEYKAILMKEAEASVRLEPGVISIFPMYMQQDSTQIRILEIYASKEAYQSHVKSAQFLHYKESTLKMVKGLKLIDMKALDAGTMKKIFKKLKM